MILEKPNDLPNGWMWTQLDSLTVSPKEHIVDGPFGSNMKASEYRSAGVPIIRLQNIERNQFIKKDIKFISLKKADQLKRHSFQAGDIAITKLGDPLGKACIVPQEMEHGIIVADVVRIRLEERWVPRKFISYLLNSPLVSNQLRNKTKGTTRPRVNLSHIRELWLPLPPLCEQHRIVAKIEGLFTQLDSGVEVLGKVKTQLKLYRKAVLKHAFEGKLTKEWREAHKSELKPASVLLEQIKEERKRNSEKKYKESHMINTTNLPELPEGWAWSYFEELAESNPNAIKAGPFGSSLKKEFYVPYGHKIYGQEQVIRENASYGDYYIDDERYEKLKSCAVKAGDILVSLVGTIGKVLILPEGAESGIINPRLVKFSLDGRLVNNAYIKAYLESATVLHFFSLQSHGGTMDILNLSILKQLPIPVPPLDEQAKVVEGIEKQLSIADALEETLEQNIIRAGRLRQSILKKAFEGRLVPQDPMDEPAEKLLERIQEERKKGKPRRKLPKIRTPDN